MHILTEKRKSSEAPLNTEVPDDFGTFTSVLSERLQLRSSNKEYVQCAIKNDFTTCIPSECIVAEPHLHVFAII